MEWADRGVVLAVRKHGENATIVSLLTERHGRHAGLVRGGQGKRARGIYQPGNIVAAVWRARLESHLGAFTGELSQAAGASLLTRPGPLGALSAACALLETTLPERAPHPECYGALTALMEALTGGDWRAAYARWELDLLAVLGFGLDLSRCAATGVTDGLAYVSPKTGRAVSIEAGRPYRDKLLGLPAFLLGGAPTPDGSDFAQALDLTGYFLTQHVFAPQGMQMPAARRRLTDGIS